MFRCSTFCFSLLSPHARNKSTLKQTNKQQTNQFFTAKAASPLDNSKERTQLEQKLKQTVVLQVSHFVLGVFTHCLTLHGNEEEEAKGEAGMKPNQILFFDPHISSSAAASPSAECDGV